MRPWGGKGRAEAVEKADDKVQGREAVGAMGHGTNEAMERHGAGRAEGAGTIWSAMEREGRKGRKGRRGRGGQRGQACTGTLSSQVIGFKAVKPWEPWGGMGPWSHGAMSH